MKDWKEILNDLYLPEIGSIWAAPNRIWTNSFAANKKDSDFHPSVVGNVHHTKISCHLIPGTTKDYRKGSCVFKVKLNPSDANCPHSFFLIDLWMTISKHDLFKLKSGWNGIENLNEKQLDDLKMQIKFCQGINV
ncbi:MAG: hypothetical protein K9I71_07240 [Ignavibacteriales bacterium]|nr:hypothetical protein [Melioribacteraceae bacterium]MCF8306044.1 hypothetical protein [Ignavibacteriales bacterium]MCF8315901.1 hypothetical protein [Ignavibacteriales bacterium]MCF8437361.1 hypothetical protein [Ignavibacteriales bacterium]